MAEKGRYYTKEFKGSTLQLALNSEKSEYQIAQDLDINDKTLFYHSILTLHSGKVNKF
jgi:transposase